VGALEARVAALEQVAVPDGSCYVRVRAFIDGYSTLVLRDGAVQWEHRENALPGKHNNHNYPTYINGLPWTPQWPQGNDSAEFRFHQIRLPETGVPVARLLEWNSDRPADEESVLLSTEEGEVRLEIDDTAEGSTWYEATIVIYPEPAAAESIGIIISK
jgi:hypothetical protein